MVLSSLEVLQVMGFVKKSGLVQREPASISGSIRHGRGLGIFHQKQYSWQVAGIKAERHKGEQVNDRHNGVGS